MIQDIGKHAFSNRYVPKRPQAQSIVLCCRSIEIFCYLTGEKSQDNSGVHLGGYLELPRFSDFSCSATALDLVYLFSVDEQDFFLARAADAAEMLMSEAGAAADFSSPRFSWESIRELRFASPRWLAFAAITGHQLATWYRNNRFCGACGYPTELAPKSREIVCPACGNVIYPRINPGVIVGILDQSHERLLLTKYARAHYRYDNYALVAGYTEVGESFEQTVLRETKEEVGLEVSKLRYWRGQPWPFSSSILVGYWCEAARDDVTVDHGELRSAVWLHRDEIPMPRRDTSSLTNLMISAFAEGFNPYAE